MSRVGSALQFLRVGSSQVNTSQFFRWSDRVSWANPTLRDPGGLTGSANSPDLYMKSREGVVCAYSSIHSTK